MKQLRVVLSLERDAKKTLGYHTLAFCHRQRIKGIGGQATVNCELEWSPA